MQRPQRIFYVGTYERDYPRNAIVIAALRRAGFDVREMHQAIWSAPSDKSAVIASPRALLRLGMHLTGAYARLLIQLVKNRRGADLVAFGYIGQADVLALAPVARLLRKPVLFNPLVTLTDTLIEDRRRVADGSPLARLIWRVDRWSFKLSDSIVVDTDSSKGFLVSTFGVPSESVHVVPVGADERLFAPAGARLSRAGQQPKVPRPLRVLFYGNMIPLQGVETIVRAAKLVESTCDARLEIIGTGQVYASVRSLANQLGLQHVTFTDRVPYEELPLRIAEADVVLGIFGDSAKAARVVPNKVYQAMAMGAAIITRDSPATRDVLRDGETALLVPPEDPVAIAGAILRLADSSLRCRLGDAARARFLEVASLEVQAIQLSAAVASALPESLVARPEVTA